MLRFGLLRYSERRGLASRLGFWNFVAQNTWHRFPWKKKTWHWFPLTILWWPYYPWELFWTPFNSCLTAQWLQWKNLQLAGIWFHPSSLIGGNWKRTVLFSRLCFTFYFLGELSQTLQIQSHPFSLSLSLFVWKQPSATKYVQKWTKVGFSIQKSAWRFCFCSFIQNSFFPFSVCWGS